jgi:hypothetical protein
MPATPDRWQQSRAQRKQKRLDVHHAVDERAAALPTDPVSGPDHIPVSIYVRQSGMSPGFAGDPQGYGVTVKLLLDVFGWIRFRGGHTVWVEAPGYRRQRRRHANQAEALDEAHRLVAQIQRNGVAGLNLRQSRTG